MKSVVALTIAALAAGAAFAQQANPAKPDLAKGQVTAATCMACHAADGTRGLPTFPNLQGQHADYIVKQLTEFKAGKRMNPIMMGMAAPLSPEDMRNVAAFYAAKPAVAGESTSKETIAQGQAIYRGGIPAKKVPACAGCHSPNGAGIPAQYPRLGGQHVEYTTAQLNTFRSGERANSLQMTAIASKLSDAEIKAVSDYIAGLR
jgi:cytochrome c553